MRKPNWSKQKRKWILKINQPDGRPAKTVTLGADRDEAFAKFDRMVAAMPEPELSAIPHVSRSPRKACDCCRCGSPADERTSEQTAEREAERQRERAIAMERSNELQKERFIATSVTAVSNRYQMVERVLLIVELLAPLRRGVTLNDLQSDLEQSVGRLSYRTVIRDCKFLTTLGLVEYSHGRVRWLADGLRAAVLKQIAGHVAEVREELLDAG